MNKPITVAREEYVQKVVEATNSCGLPAFVVRDVLKSLLDEANALANQQLRQDAKEWEKFLESQEQDGETSDMERG